MTGIKQAPWYALWLSGMVAQAGLFTAQILAYKQDGGIWVTLGLGALQALTGIGMAYGPVAAGKLAGHVGDAVASSKKE